jgi:hypothetical protein
LYFIDWEEAEKGIKALYQLGYSQWLAGLEPATSPLKAEVTLLSLPKMNY